MTGETAESPVWAWRAPEPGSAQWLADAAEARERFLAHVLAEATAAADAAERRNNERREAP